MPVLFLGLRANILFLSTNGGNCPHRTVKERDETSEQGLASAKAPSERPVKRSVAALLTGSSRQRLNGFIGRTSLVSDWTGDLLFRAPPSVFSQTTVSDSGPILKTGRRLRRHRPPPHYGGLGVCTGPDFGKRKKTDRKTAISVCLWEEMWVHRQEMAKSSILSMRGGG